MYAMYMEKEIEPFWILLEAGQGKNINGNMFSMAKVLLSDQRWLNHQVFFVVNKTNIKAAQQRFETYGLKVKLIIRDSRAYKKCLACCKYLITDNSFPPYFLKRSQQVYINTWHGTPLKKLGIADIKNATSLANIQKNFMMCDYALFPNTFTKNVFMKDYGLKDIFNGSYVIADYPRNQAFIDITQQKNLRRKLQLDKKTIYAYMPTWRGNNRDAEATLQKDILENYFKQLDASLNNDEILYVNLHFLIDNTIDYSQYEHILPFPDAYETYEFLSICDVLISDYSSVIFDFCISKKKIILFAYDEKLYLEERGMYLDLQSLPFPIVSDVTGLIKQLRTKTIKSYANFIKEYHAYDDPETSAHLCMLMREGKSTQLQVKKHQQNTNISLLYGGKLQNKQLNMELQQYIKEVRKNTKTTKVVLCFQGKFTTEKINFLTSLPNDITLLALVNKYEFTLKTKIIQALGMRYQFFAKRLKTNKQSIYEKEKQRLFYNLEVENTIYYAGVPRYMYKICAMFPNHKIAHIHHNNIIGVTARRFTYHVMTSYFQKFYDEAIDHRFEDVKALWKEEPETYYNKCLQLGNIIHHFKNNKEGMKISALSFAYTILPFSLKNLSITINDINYPLQIKEGLRIGKGIRITRYSFIIPYEDMRKLEIQNKINLYFVDPEGFGICKGIKYHASDFRKGHHRHGPIHMFKTTFTSAYFRQTINNVLYLTIRKSNISDTKKQQFKIKFAYFLSLFNPFSKAILLYEKEGATYEESASILYEKLIDQKNKHAYYVLDKKYPHIEKIGKQYQKNILWKGSLRHYLYFFKAKTFLGSEAMVHAIDLRVASRIAQRKLNKQNVNYVFLQHGVMYMVSLDSESRTFFKPKKTHKKYRVVVSSKLEAQHFMELANYKPEMIYISGLPKFDENKWHKDADKIVIMPTWRPWEYNDARYDFENTKYYQMLQRMLQAIPKQFLKRVVILPHPLLLDALKAHASPLDKYISKDGSYDAILQECKVLITDYSSIAYDAFYRGANVVFYWEEKAMCMEAYGPTTKLMLNEENAFGDICYNSEQLQAHIERNVSQLQSKTYKERYRQIVSFHDQQNTKRLLQFLKKDGLI